MAPAPGSPRAPKAAKIAQHTGTVTQLPAPFSWRRLYVMNGVANKTCETPDLLLHAVVHPADIQDRDGGILVVSKQGAAPARRACAPRAWGDPESSYAARRPVIVRSRCRAPRGKRVKRVAPPPGTGGWFRPPLWAKFGESALGLGLHRMGVATRTHEWDFGLRRLFPGFSVEPQ